MLTARNPNTTGPYDSASGSKSHRQRSLGSQTRRLQPVKSNSNFFITQDVTKHNFIEEGTSTGIFDEKRNTKPTSSINAISDQRVKGVLNRLNSTINKLKIVSDKCEKTVERNSVLHHSKHTRSASTFALTQPTFDLMLQSHSTTKSTMNINNFLSMNESEFLNPQSTFAIAEAARSIDGNPYTVPVSEALWSNLTQGMDYMNELKYEIARKTGILEKAKQQLQELDKALDTTILKERANHIKKEIEAEEAKIEWTEMHQETLEHTITTKRKDLLISWQKFQTYMRPFQWASHTIEKQVDAIIKISKTLQRQEDELKSIQQQSKENLNNRRIIDTKRGEDHKKVERLQLNLEIEKLYQTKRNDLVAKTKREIEVGKETQLENQRRLQRKKQAALFDLLQGFEEDLDRLSAVSKPYANKEDYLSHLESLEQNYEDLQNKIKELTEELDLKKKIEIPTLKAELEQSKTDNIKKANVFEKTQLFKVLQEKLRRNQLHEKQIAHKEALINSATRGVMTIFYKLSLNKTDLGLEKLDEVKLKRDNLGDVLLLCGEILETVTNIHNEPSQIKSNPMSHNEFFDDD